MACHLRFLLILITVGVAALTTSSPAFGTITFLSYDGFSNIIAPPTTAQPSPTPFTSPIPGQSPAPAPGVPSTPPQFFYSNISSTAVTDAVTPQPTYEDAVTAGTTCSPAQNQQCKNPSDLFTMTVVSNAPVTGGANYFYWVYTGATAPLPGTAIAGLKQIVPQQLYAQNQAITFQATWASICAAVAGSSTPVNGLGSNCQDTGPTLATPIPRGPRQVTFYLVADTNSTGTVGSELQSFTVNFVSSIRQYSETADALGLYGFLTYPGDQKVYIQGLPGTGGIQTDADFPTQTSENGAIIQTVRVYYTSTPLAGGSYDPTANYNATNFNSLVPPATPGTPANFDLTVNQDGSLQSTEVTGLSNGLMYYFRVALVDQAGNIGYLTQPGVEDTVNHTAIPDQVVGLLSNSHCFIATAAFGSPWTRQVKILRAFRDKFLLPTRWGRDFVSWYYRNSPPWADRIARHEAWKAAVRAGLYPLIVYSFLALKIGAFNAALALSTLLMLPLLFLRWKRTQRPWQGTS